LKELLGGNVTRKFYGKSEENRDQIFGMRFQNTTSRKSSVNATYIKYN